MAAANCEMTRLPELMCDELKLFKAASTNKTRTTSIEYAMIASIISLAIIAGATQIGINLKTTFTNVATNMSK